MDSSLGAHPTQSARFLSSRQDNVSQRLDRYDNDGTAPTAALRADGVDAVRGAERGQLRSAEGLISWHGKRGPPLALCSGYRNCRTAI